MSLCKGFSLGAFGYNFSIPKFLHTLLACPWASAIMLCSEKPKIPLAAYVPQRTSASVIIFNISCTLLTTTSGTTPLNLSVTAVLKMRINNGTCESASKCIRIGR